MQKMETTEIVAFDLETTGISSFVDHVVDIGAVRFRLDETSVDTFDQLVDPKRDIPTNVTAIHGITDADVKGQPVIREVLPEFDKFIGSDALLVAHNAPFDCSFLAAAYTASDLRPPNNQIICSLRLFRLAFPEFENYKLETIGKRLGLINHEEHRGLADSLLLMRCLKLAFEVLPQFEYLDSLLAASKVFQFTDFSSADVIPPDDFIELQFAIEEGYTLEIRYGEFPDRPILITPKLIFQQNNKYYVNARCHYAEFDKTYRLDRIVSYKVLQK